MSEFDQGVEQAESPTATTDATTGQAPSAPANGNGQTVPYERFAQVNGRMREFEQRYSQSEQRAAALDKRIEQLEAARAGTNTPPSQEEQAAVAALERLMAQHPKMKLLLDNADKFTGVQQSVEQMTERQFNSTLTSGDRQIAEFAKANGLPTDPKFVTNFQTQVGAVIKAHPQAEARLRAGDLSVVDEASKYVLDLMAPLRQGNAAALASTKSNVRNLPPRSAAGTTPGAAAPEKFDASKDTPQSYWEKALQKARAITAGMAAEG